MKKYQLKIILCMILCEVAAGLSPLSTAQATVRSINDYVGSRVITMQANELEWEDGFVTAVNDTAFALGWGVNLNFGNADNELIASGLYSGFNIPIYLDAEAGAAILPVDVQLDYQEFISGGCTHDDVRRYVFALDADYLLNEEATDYGDIVGTLCDDGTIHFEGAFVFYIMDCVTHVVNGRVRSTDTTYLCSPILHDMTLQVPNGVHSFTKSTAGQTASLPTDVVNFIPSSSFIADIILRRKIDGMLSPDGHGGLVPKPIDPRKPVSLSGGGDSVDGDDDGGGMMKSSSSGKSSRDWKPVSNVIIDLFDPSRNQPFGSGGLVPVPIDPRRPTTSSDDPYPGSMMKSPSRITIEPSAIPGLVIENTSTDMTVPIYIHQVDDTTVHVFNLFGHGYSVASMKIYGDGTMDFPAQLLLYDTQRLEDFYNFSYTQNSYRLNDGCSGTVTADQIAWDDATLLYSESGIYDYYYENNVLAFTNGEEFSLMDTTASLVDFFTIDDAVVSRGDVVDVTVTLTIASDITAFHATVHLPEGFELVGNVRLLNPAEGQSMSVTAMDDGSYRIDGTATGQDVFAATAGVTFSMTVKAPATADGEYRYNVRNIQLTNVAGDKVNCRNAPGTVTVMPYLMGDMNNDGELDVSDVAKLIRKILNSH